MLHGRNLTRHEIANAGSGEAQSDHDGKDQIVSAKRRVQQPQRDGGKKHRRRRLRAAVISRRLAAARCRRDARQESVAAGVDSGPADAAQGVGEQDHADEGEKAQQHARRQHEQAERQHAALAPAVRPVTDKGPGDHAGRGKRGDRQSDHEGRTAQLGDVERDRRVEHGLLRVAQRLDYAQQCKRRGPELCGFSNYHRCMGFHATKNFSPRSEARRSEPRGRV